MNKNARSTSSLIFIYFWSLNLFRYLFLDSDAAYWIVLSVCFKFCYFLWYICEPVRASVLRNFYVITIRWLLIFNLLAVDDACNQFVRKNTAL